MMSSYFCGIVLLQRREETKYDHLLQKLLNVYIANYFVMIVMSVLIKLRVRYNFDKD